MFGIEILRSVHAVILLLQLAITHTLVHQSDVVAQFYQTIPLSLGLSAELGMYQGFVKLHLLFAS